MKTGRLFVFLTGSLIGAALFLLTYGTGVLIVTNDGWISRITDVDIHQHYLGWCHFRNSPWSFPLGLFDSLSYPYKMSILWTDSIPLLAIIFKLFRGILPETFQYFGIYGLISQMLTGGTAALFIKEITGNATVSCLSVPFFAMSFPMLQRMFYHTSLTAHYLIFIPLLFFIYDEGWSIKKKCVLWGGYFFTAVMIHPYLWFMGGVIAVFSFIYGTVKSRDPLPLVVTGLVSGVVTAVALFITGAFYGDVNLSYKAGGYEANLNTFINPLKMGRFLPELPLFSPGQYEGFGYLGAGGILLLISGICCFIVSSGKSEAKEKGKGKVLFLMGTVFFILAVIPDISVNTKLIFNVGMPGVLQEFFGIFRSGGRFIWPVLYLLYALSLFLICRYIPLKEPVLRKVLPLLVVMVSLVLQIYDMGDEILSRRERFSEMKKGWHSDLENEALLKEEDKYKHIFFVTNDSFRMERSAYFAAKKGLTVNRFYFARDIDPYLDEELEKYYKLCSTGQAPSDTIFVFDDDTVGLWMNTTDLHFYDLTGTIVGLADEIDWEEYK